MVAAYEVHRLGVLYFERQQQADGLQGVGPPVHIVAQEEVVYVGDVPCRGGGPILVEEPHEVQELPVQVTEDLDRRCSSRAKLSWA